MLRRRGAVGARGGGRAHGLQDPVDVVRAAPVKRERIGKDKEKRRGEVSNGRSERG